MTAVAGLAAVAVWIALPLPAGLLTAGRQPALIIQDRNGATLREARAEDGSRARWVAYGDVDPDLINAFVAVEDRRFWDHHGVDAQALARAVWDDARSRHVVSGASTITMQLARLLRPAPRNWTGKISQALWALRLERHLTKQQILEQYVNRVQLGQAAVGVASATSLYFATNANQVSLGQAATLAGLAHAPSRDNPFTSPTLARAQRATALARMRRLGYATAEDARRAVLEPLVAVPGQSPFRAPHFTSRVIGWMADDSARISTVRTSVDLTLQDEVEREVRHTVDVLGDRGVNQAAAVVLDNESGEVLAWVGSPDFWAAPDGQTDMVASARQPGSALKPFLYALALDRGFTAATVLPDIPKTYATATGPYHPRDYDRKFRGPVRAREALASSYNVPAVELASRVGTGSLLHTLHLAGFESLDRDAEFYGLGLALGNGDVQLIELANAYRALANGGEWRPWTWRASPANGPPVAGAAGGRRIASPTASAIVLDILRDPAARVPAFGTVTPFDFPFPVAVKTGTSRHFTDNWAVGTTRRFTVAVWAGNFSGRPMEGVSGITGAGPLLHRVVMVVSKRWSPGELTTPAEAGAVSVPVCRLSGMVATPTCARIDEWFAPGTAPTRGDDWEFAGRVILPDEYAAWSHAFQVDSVAPARVAAAADTAAEHRDFRILSPLDGDKYWVPAGAEARYATIGLRASGAARVRWSVDGRVHSSDRWSLAAGEHVIRAVAGEDSAEVRILVERQ